MRLSFLVIAAGISLWFFGLGIWLFLVGVIMLAGEEHLRKKREAATERVRLAKRLYEERHRHES